MSLLNIKVSKPTTQWSQEILFDWSIYLTVLHIIGQSKMNERLHGMTPKQDVVRWFLISVKMKYDIKCMNI